MKLGLRRGDRSCTACIVLFSESILLEVLFMIDCASFKSLSYDQTTRVRLN